jgi:hypothetical protein
VPTTFSATGAVVEESTNQPISGAELEILNGPNAGRTFQTDSAGLYSITGLSPGSFTVRFRATGYDPADRLITITNANVRTDVALRRTVTTTTTTTSVPSTTLRADFTVTPVPCTITGAAAVVDCTVDSAPSTGAITSYTWTYLGITVTNNFRFVLALTCANTGTTQEATIQVTLAVTDATLSQNSTTKPVTVRKSNACGFGP